MIQNSAFGETIIELNEIDSTNNYAMRLINEGMAEHGLVIKADFQTHGKGQHGNVWIAEESKNLLCSVILDTKALEIDDQFLLNCMTCVSVTEVLMQHYNIPNVSVKWPNDIYAGKNKIGGILIENNIRGSKWTNAVIGIGLNVNQSTFSYLNNATSIKNELQKEIKINVVLKQLLKKMGSNINIFNREPKQFLSLYNNYLLQVGQQIEFMRKFELKVGLLKGVNKNGAIEIEENQKIKSYQHKEIELLIQ